jgi:hypothetical protein
MPRPQHHVPWVEGCVVLAGLLASPSIIATLHDSQPMLTGTLAITHWTVQASTYRQVRHEVIRVRKALSSQESGAGECRPPPACRPQRSVDHLPRLPARPAAHTRCAPCSSPPSGTRGCSKPWICSANILETECAAARRFHSRAVHKCRAVPRPCGSCE